MGLNVKVQYLTWPHEMSSKVSRPPQTSTVKCSNLQPHWRLRTAEIWMAQVKTCSYVSVALMKPTGDYRQHVSKFRHALASDLTLPPITRQLIVLCLLSYFSLPAPCTISQLLYTHNTPHKHTLVWPISRDLPLDACLLLLSHVITTWVTFLMDFQSCRKATFFFRWRLAQFNSCAHFKQTKFRLWWDWTVDWAWSAISPHCSTLGSSLLLVLYLQWEDWTRLSKYGLRDMV